MKSSARLPRLLLPLLILFVAFTISGNSSAADTHTPVRIAAASSLRFVLADIVEAYVAHSGKSAPQVVYGSSGNLYRQISQGAPFDLFLSADAELTLKLENSNPRFGTATEFGAGRLVLFTHNESAVSLLAFKELLARTDDFKVAIANPRHAPFGRAAQQALESLDFLNAAKPRLVFAEKVSQAAQFVTSGATEFALISRSLALSPALKESGRYTLIPQQHHQPVVQSMIVLTPEKPVQDLFSFILENQSSIEILQQYGLRER